MDGLPELPLAKWEVHQGIGEQKTAKGSLTGPANPGAAWGAAQKPIEQSGAKGGVRKLAQASPYPLALMPAQAVATAFESIETPRHAFLLSPSRFRPRQRTELGFGALLAGLHKNPKGFRDQCGKESAAHGSTVDPGLRHELRGCKEASVSMRSCFFAIPFTPAKCEPACAFRSFSFKTKSCMMHLS